jgi:3-hydroxybutyryl-CoA dehydratase
MGERGGSMRDGLVARPFSELRVGDELWGALTVTEGHVVAAAGAFNDPGPNHLNVLHASAGRFGGRVAHGPLLVGIAIGVLGNSLGTTIVALLEQSSRFLAPVRLGDTVIPHWTVAETTPKESLGGGIVRFEGQVQGTGGEKLIELTAKLAVAEEPPWTPWGQVSAGEGAAAAGDDNEIDRSDD